MPPQNQREAVAATMDIEYHPSGFKVFDEGDEGDKLFVVAEGCVDMYKRAAISGCDELVGSCSTEGERPWFGELAMWCAPPCTRELTHFPGAVR